MWEVFLILAGYAFCSAAVVSLGRVFARRLKLEMGPAESWAVWWMLGSAAASVVLLLLSLSGLIGVVPLGLACAASIAVGCRPASPQRSGFSWPGAAVALFLAVYFIVALAPSYDSDGYRYHLGFPHLYLDRGRMFPIREDFYSAFPQGMEMQYLLGLRFGGFSVANLLHWNALAALALGLCSWPAGVWAAAAIASASVVGSTAASASVDVALAAAVWISFHCWMRWRDSGDRGWLVAASIGAGFACAIKYTGVSAVLVAILFLVSRPDRLRNSILAAAASAAVFAPWLARNWAYFRNPVYPFLNAIFPNPYLLPSSEAIWREVVQSYNGAGFTSAYPWEAAIRGVTTMGFAGPFFLLAPLAALAAWRPRGRWMLAAGALTALPWIFGNPILRFGIPTLPFLAMGIVMAFHLPSRPARGVLALGVLVQLAMCFPPFIERWNKQWIVAVKQIPWRTAFRLQTPEQYWTGNIPSYRLLRYVDAQTPAGTRVLAFDGQEQFFTTRLLANPYASEESASAAALLDRAADTTAWPSARCRASFPDVRAGSVRIIQRNREQSPWTIFEVKVNGEAPGNVTANPNPWEARETVDGNSVTAWSSKAPKRDGMWLEASWTEPRPVTEIELVASLAYGEMTAEAAGKTVRMECEGLEVEDFPRRSVQELERRGWKYLIAERNYPWLEQMSHEPETWGLHVALTSGAMKLLAIRPPDRFPPPGGYDGPR